MNKKKTITFDISIESVADKLSELMVESDNKQLVIESIISGLSKAGDNYVGNLYKSLTGHPLDIPFRIGDKVYCNMKIHNTLYQNVIENGVSTFKEIGEAKVVDKDIYSLNKLKISFTSIDTDGNAFDRVAWVNDNDCELITNYSV